MWIISIAILVIGVLLTIRMAMIRPVGYVLLGVGGFGLIWSLSKMGKGKDFRDKDDNRHFN